MRTRNFYPKQLWRRLNGCQDESLLTGMERQAYAWFRDRVLYPRGPFVKDGSWLVYSGTPDQLPRGEVILLPVEDWVTRQASAEVAVPFLTDIGSKWSRKILEAAKAVTATTVDGERVFRIVRRKLRRMSKRWSGSRRGRSMRAWLTRCQMDSQLTGGFMHRVSGNR